MLLHLARPFVAALLAVVLLVPSARAAGEAGVILYASGSVTATSGNGVTRELARRSPVYAGDLVRTKADGRAQIRFTDGGIVALKPASELRLDEYAYGSGGDQKSVMSLIKGGFRTMTGAIGKLNKADYKVNTPVATIGIRGTLYEVWFDEHSGLGLGVWDGGISACNGNGCLDLGMNADHRFGFIPLDGSLNGQDSEPHGIGAGADIGMGLSESNLAALLAGATTSSGNPLGNTLLPRGLSGAQPGVLARSNYPQIAYALIPGVGVIASSYASSNLNLAGGLVNGWSFVDNASGVEFSAASPYLSSWYASVDTFSGSPVISGNWLRVNVGLSAGDPNPALSTNPGSFYMANYVSPQDVMAFAQRVPLMYLYMNTSRFEMSGLPAAFAYGNLAINFGADVVTGNIRVGDNNTNAWNLNLTGTTTNGVLSLALAPTSTFTSGTTAAISLPVAGSVSASFYGTGTVSGVIGGLSASTVGANPLSGNVETLRGIFRIDSGG